ncbi:MAG: hypothetical protein M0Z32_05290 [Actinomycetota bacterium]|jgi:hypothetical protein|nr:PH domain-containing protein [Actinomycetota bacterium]MDA8167150.1 hypothetical protein [Actinomycetota bacterium]
MVHIEIEDGRLCISVEGLHQALSLKKHIDIPLSHVQGAHPDPGAAKGWQGIRAPGAYFPGLITAGSFKKDGEWSFFDVHNPDRALVIDLENEHYKRLVVEVGDPAATAEIINEAIKAAQ